MKNSPAFSHLIRRSGPAAYKALVFVSALTVLVWVLFSSFDIRDVNGWLPYHVPISIVLSLILLILTLISWTIALLGGPPPASVAEKATPQLSEPRRKPRYLRSMFRKPPRVLVVDDDPSVRMVLCKKLSSLGTRATGVSDGLEALLAVADRRWDMILMDGEMPFMDGIEATREIRAQQLLPEQTPIVSITSRREWNYRQECLAAGMTACRPKPRHTEDLESLLDEFLVVKGASEASKLEGRVIG